MVGGQRHTAQKGGSMGRMKRSLRALFGTISPPCPVLRAASLLEAIVAAVVLLLVFTATMELLPRFTLRNDDALLVAEAEYRVDRAFDTYASGVWPQGEYIEHYDWGTVSIRLEPYRKYGDLQLVTITAHIEGSSKRIIHKEVIQWLG